MFYRISMITKKMLIKRVSSFQVVQTMSCVSNKHMSHRQMIRKVKGRTFYLLLQETFNKVCPPENRINLNHELFEVYPKCLKLFGKIWWILIKCIRLRHRTWRSIECFSYSSRMNLVTAKYTHLSDIVLKILRDKLKTVLCLSIYDYVKSLI